MSAPEAQAFEGLCVLDLSVDVAGAFCARLFADQGAEVAMIEPEGGHPLRRKEPFDRNGCSLAFAHLMLGKRIEVQAQRQALLAAADVVVAPASELPALRAELPERVVLVGVSAFGTDGPLTSWRGPEIVIQALSGMMNNNGEPGRPPLFGMGERASYSAGVAAHAGAVAALLARDGLHPGGGTGRGQEVRVDVAETAAAMCFPYVLQYEYNGTDRRRGDQDIPVIQVRCRGTWVCIWVYPFRFAAMCGALGLDRLVCDPRYADPRDRTKNWAALVSEVQAAVADEDGEATVARLQEAQVIASVAYRPGELHRSPHLAHRRYWREAGVPSGRALGPAFRLTEGRAARRDA